MGTTILVVPCYNEAARLVPQTWIRFVDGEPALQILFVDDGSTDETAHRIEQVRALRPDRVQLLRLDRNRGKAEAVRTGILEALKRDPETVGYWDADLSTPLEAVSEFVDVLARFPEVELVIGARVQLLGRSVERSAVRHYLGRVFAAFASLTLGLRVYDTQCGAKLFRVTDGTAALFRDPFLSRWAFDVEVLARMGAVRGSMAAVADAVYEVPLRTWLHATGSKVRASDFPRSVWDLYRIRRRYGR